MTIARIRKEFSDSEAFKWQLERVAGILRFSGGIMDTSRTSVSCSVGLSRGNKILRGDGANFPGLGILATQRNSVCATGPP